MIFDLLFDIADEPSIIPYTTGPEAYIIIGVGVALLALVVFLIVKLAKKK